EIADRESHSNGKQTVPTFGGRAPQELLLGRYFGHGLHHRLPARHSRRAWCMPFRAELSLRSALPVRAPLGGPIVLIDEGPPARGLSLDPKIECELGLFAREVLGIGRDMAKQDAKLHLVGRENLLPEPRGAVGLELRSIFGRKPACRRLLAGK